MNKLIKQLADRSRIGTVRTPKMARKRPLEELYSSVHSQSNGVDTTRPRLLI